VLPPEKANGEASTGPMPDVPNVLMAFVAEHQRCGDLDGGRDGGYIWLTCTRGAQIVHPASAPPSAPTAGDSRK
jgi:hypothetical protein